MEPNSDRATDNEAFVERDDEVSPDEQEPTDPELARETDRDAASPSSADLFELPPLGDLLRDRRTCLIWLVAGGVILALGILGMLLFTWLDPDDSPPGPAATRSASFITSTPRPTATRTPTATPTPTITPSPSPTPDVVLLGVRALGELNTVQYNLKTVVEKHVEQTGQVVILGREVWRPDLHFLLVAGGQVKAGVDFAEMVRYEIDGDKVVVYLPPPRITGYAVDTANLKLYYIRTDFGLDEEFVIETYNEAIGDAQESLRQAALDSDILETARTNATALVQSLILGLGFSEVQVQFVESGGDEPLLEVTPEFIITPAPFATATPEG